MAGGGEHHTERELRLRGMRAGGAEVAAHVSSSEAAGALSIRDEPPGARGAFSGPCHQIYLSALQRLAVLQGAPNFSA